MKKVLAFLVALSLALGVCSAAFAEGVNVYQFISVYYWFLAINSSDVGIPIIDVTVFEMDKYDLYGAYRKAARWPSKGYNCPRSE